MIFPAIAKIHDYKVVSGDKYVVPGSRFPLKITEVAILGYGSKDFVAYQLKDYPLTVVAALDQRFKHLFISGPTLPDALNAWWSTFETHGGEGL